MANNMEEVAKKAQHDLMLLADLSYQAVVLGDMGNMYMERYLRKGAYRETSESGIQWVMRCFSRPRYFYKMFRMNPDVFMQLHDLLFSNYGLRSTNNVFSIESLAMFLWIIGGPQSFAQVENRFTRSTWTVHTKFHEVLKCMCKLAKDNIKPHDPTFGTVHDKLKEDRFWPHFKDAIGAIDGSHVPVIVPSEEVLNYINRYGYTSQNVLAVCDFDMRFIFAVAGWPGSAHDSRILNHALANFPSFPTAPIGKYYLVDSGYANRKGYLAPFKGTAYHIQEFRRRSSRAPQGKYEMFNYLHSSLRNVIERSFGVLKQKWRILYGIPSFPTRTQKHIIIACMALHNFIRDSKLHDKEFDQCDVDPNYLLSDDSSSDDDDDDDDDGTIEAQEDVDMNTFCSRIADALVSASGR